MSRLLQLIDSLRSAKDWSLREPTQERGVTDESGGGNRPAGGFALHGAPTLDLRSEREVIYPTELRSRCGLFIQSTRPVIPWHADLTLGG